MGVCIIHFKTRLTCWCTQSISYAKTSNFIYVRLILNICSVYFHYVPSQTTQHYAKEFKKLTGFNARHEASFAYDAAWAIALVLNTSMHRLAGTLELRK